MTTRAAGVFATPAIGDIDHDGLPDIVASSWDQHVYAWNHIGAILPGLAPVHLRHVVVHRRRSPTSTATAGSR